MRNPLPLVALLYAGGLVLGLYLPGQLPWLCALSLTAGLAALCLEGRRPFVLCLFVPLVAWTNLVSRTAVVSPRDLRLLIGQEPQDLALRGVLAETPVVRITQRAGRVSERSMAEVEVQSIQSKGAWLLAAGRLIATTPGVLGDRFFAGQHVELTGVVQPPKGPTAPGQFDYRRYLRDRGVYHQLTCESTNDWQLTLLPKGATPPVPTFCDRFCVWAQSTLAKGLPEQDESLRLLWAMVLGWKTALTPEVAEPFMQSGTLHIFAISGMHIALIAGILISLLRVLRVPRTISGLVVLPLIWFYTAATGWQASAIRSTVMMSIILAGWTLARPSNLINSLAAAGLIILLWDPTQLFQASFQLSFFVVLGLALIVPPLERVRKAWLRHDPLVPEDLRPRWQRWLDAPVRLLSTSLATSLAAWLGSLPLIAYYFYMVTPNSLLANILIVPLSSLALMSSLGSLVCGDWFAWGTVLFNHSSWFWMLCMMRSSQWFAALPGAYFYVRAPGLVEFAAYYLLLAAVLSGLLWKPRWRLGVSLVLSGLMALCMVGWIHHRAQLRLTILPTSAGSLFIEPARFGKPLLLDCGDSSTAERVVKPFLRSQGVNRLPKMLLTQGDVRHVGGAELILTHFHVGQILTSAVRARSSAYRDLLAKLKNDTNHWQRVGRGDQWREWTVLHPAHEDSFSQSGDGTVVLSAECTGTRVLLVSSLSRRGQNTLLNRQPDLRAEVLITGMPTQGEPASESLLETVQPSLLIIASAEYPATVRPSTKLRERLAQLKIPVLYTSDTGAVALRLGQGGWDLTTMDGRHLSGRRRRAKPSPRAGYQGRASEGEE